MILPKQKISTSAKYKKDEVSGLTPLEQTAAFYIEQSTFNNDYEEILNLYKMLENEIDESTYNYVLNPFNTKVKKYTKFRGRLRNFDIITPVIEMFASEFGRRTHSPSVIQSNPLDKSQKEEYMTNLLKGYFTQRSVNRLNSIGVETGKPSVEQPPIEEAKEEFKRGYTENRVITGQEALDYIIYDKDLHDKYIDLYEEYLITGRAISYKAVLHNDIHFEHIPAIEAYFPHSVNFKRLEDRDWFVRKYSMTPNQLLDRHKDKLNDKLLEALDDFNGGGEMDSFDGASGVVYMSDDDFNEKYSHFYKNEENAVDCYHTTFRSFTRVAVLTYENIQGEVVEMDVEEDYKIDKEAGDLDITYEYRNSLYESTLIEFNGIKEYIDTKEIPYDRTELNSKGYPKLPYNGIATVTKTGKIKSVVKSGENYQIIYNILKYDFEKTMNKNKDKISIIPLGLLNKGKQGWDADKAMYYAEANSTLFVDETSPNFNMAVQAIKVLDMSLGKYAGEMIGFIEQVKQEWWDSVGMNRQRYGETKASDGKATNEQAVFRSSLVSENLVRKFEKFQEKDYVGFLDLSKLAWIDGVKGKYINGDKRESFLDLNADQALYHLESDYDVHVIFSGEENDKREFLKEYLFNYTQNGGSAAASLDAMDSTSFAKGREIVRKAEEAREALEEQTQQAERESQEKIAQMEQQTVAAANEMKKYEVDKRYDAVIDAKTLEIENREPQGNSEADDLLEALKTEHQINKDNKEMTLKEKEAALKEKEAASKITKEGAETSKIKKETKYLTKDKPKTNN